MIENAIHSHNPAILLFSSLRFSYNTYIRKKGREHTKWPNLLFLQTTL